MINRRGLITGLISLAAAPAIVRVESLMPVKVIRIEITYAEFIQAMIKVNSEALKVMLEHSMMYGSSVTKVEYDTNTPHGIVFTPIHNYLKLD